MFLPVALEKTPAAGTGIKHIILVTMKDRGATCQERFVVCHRFCAPVRTREERHAAACPSRAHFSIFHGQHFGLILFFILRAAMTSGEIRRRSALFRPASEAEKQYKKVLRPRFSPERRMEASGSPQRGRRPLRPLPIPARRLSNAPGPPCLAAKRPRIMLLWSKSIPDPSCGQCSGRRDGPRPWPE